MNYRKIVLSVIVVGFIWITGCENFVQEVEDPIDVVNSEQLNSEDQVAFFMNGVIGRYDITHDALTVIAGGLSDALEFDSENVRDATFPTFRDIDNGDIQFDNNSVDGPFNTLGQARFLADDFLSRVNEIDFEDADLRQRAIYNGNLYAGLSRYIYAAYFGLEPENGGGVIDNSPFIPSADMYSRALDNLEDALSNAPTAYEEKVVNSLIGRIHVYQGNHGTASSFLENGLAPGDAPFQSLHSLESQNAFSAQAGASRNQYTVASRYYDYIEADANEANRILLEVLPEAEVTDAGVAAGVTIYRQTKYFQDTNIDVISWQENHLLRAEVELQTGGATGPDNARDLIDEVRDSHGIDPLPLTETVDIALLLVERDKELYLTGNRMIDQRRYDNWHLPAGSWKYFPITQSERNNNPNL